MGTISLMVLRISILVISLIWGGMTFAQEYQNKTALVIGNTNYEVGRLRNPVNDARVLSETLSNLGFKVTTKYDLSRVGLREAIREFGLEIRDKEGIAFFYYSGHGLQSEGINYLVPVDADIHEEYEIRDQCVSADQVLRMLDSYKNPFNIIILDACRNNPYESRYRSGGSNGLAHPEVVPTGSIMAFSTAPGRTASDGDGDFGLYTQELIRAINTPGLDIESVFKQTRIRVMELSGNKQIPWETSSLIGDFYFVDSGNQNISPEMIPIFLDYKESIIKDEEHKEMVNRILKQLSVKIQSVHFETKDPLYYDVPLNIKRVRMSTDENIIISEYFPNGKVNRQEQYSNNFLTSSKDFKYDIFGNLTSIDFTVLSNEDPVAKSIQLYRGDSTVFWSSISNLNFRYKNIYIATDLVLNVQEQDFDFTLNFINLLRKLPKNHVFISYSELFRDSEVDEDDSLIHVNTYGTSFSKKNLYSYKLSNAKWKLVKTEAFTMKGDIVKERIFELMDTDDLVTEYERDSNNKITRITKIMEDKIVGVNLYSRNLDGFISQLEIRWDFDDQGNPQKVRNWIFSYDFYPDE